MLYSETVSVQGERPWLDEHLRPFLRSESFPESAPRTAFLVIFLVRFAVVVVVVGVAVLVVVAGATVVVVVVVSAGVLVVVVVGAGVVPPDLTHLSPRHTRPSLQGSQRLQTLHTPYLDTGLMQVLLSPAPLHV
jgi:hypothetical protein